MLLVQTRRDRKETRAPLCTRVEYEVHAGVCVYWTPTRCYFVNLQNGRTNTLSNACLFNLENGLYVYYHQLSIACYQVIFYAIE